MIWWFQSFFPSWLTSPLYYLGMTIFGAFFIVFVLVFCSPVFTVTTVFLCILISSKTEFHMIVPDFAPEVVETVSKTFEFMQYFMKGGESPTGEKIWLPPFGFWEIFTNGRHFIVHLPGGDIVAPDNPICLEWEFERLARVLLQYNIKNHCLRSEMTPILSDYDDFVYHGPSRLPR